MNESDLYNHLIELEQTLLKPEVRLSSEALDELLADDFLEFGSSGIVIDKEDCLGEGGVGALKMTLYDFKVSSLAPDVAQTTYRVFDETRNRHTLRSSIWRYRDNKWQMFFHQGTISK
ncbi:nuclear transport factor 2 family protein [Halalkalibacter akibai]|uniref:DUF4440 domain-containing protein n=1 Tax=Halalkalibacter akibai (strain ATCC 43226 / DSM 21942 / CIP 109018 / JCM 9157 / 1139) TaxID=1236973 RepID=W4QUY3_HALA3|nr:DUF4440 domain-containing protein [Halalkalibacter akibai]GAE35742.1 hypothetical protein JCM9157_2870 [Halalkalibacter akibai JCM 9157]